MPKLNVNKELLPMKGHYFLWNAGTAPVVPFMSVYAKQLGFTSFTVGIIYTVLPFSGMLAKPIMGAVADKYKCQRLIFLIAQAVAAMAFFGMIFLPSLPAGVTSTSKIHFACDSGEAVLDSCRVRGEGCSVAHLRNDFVDREGKCHLRCPLKPSHRDVVCRSWNRSEFCSSTKEEIEFTAILPLNHTYQIKDCIYFIIKNVEFTDGSSKYPYCPYNHSISSWCDIECDVRAINAVVEEPKAQGGNVYDYYEFWLLFCVYLVGWVGQAVTVSVADTICFQLLGDKPNKYGYQRMCGALGWGIFSIISGFLVDLFSKDETLKNYGPVFGIGVALLILSVLVSYSIKFTQQQISASILKDLGQLLSDLRIIIFMIWCVCMGLLTALMWNFLFWLLEDLAAQQGCDMMSWIKTIEGLVMGIQCLGGELPFFFLSSFILRKIGHINAMSLVLFVSGIRFIYYSLMTNPWWCLPIEFCNGLTFGLFYATMASYASIVAPPGTETTTQGLVGAVFEGVGVSLGSFLGGLMFQEYGGSSTFRIFGVAALVVGLVHVIVQLILSRSTKMGKDSMARYAAPEDALSIFDEDDPQEMQLVQ